MTGVLSAEVVSHLQVMRYVIVACLTVCVWDWIAALAEEYQMVYRSGKRNTRYLFLVIYFLSRAGAILYLAGIFVLAAISPNSVHVITPVVASAMIVAVPATSALFFTRLSAVYLGDRNVVAFFGACWLVTFGCFLMDSISLLSRYNQINNSTLVEHKDAAGFISSLVYDTLIYLAISWKLASFSMVSGRWRGYLRSFVYGDGLFQLSKALLHSGQVYYCVTIGFSIGTVVFMFHPAVPPEWKGLFAPINIATASVMACRLFRQLKLGLIGDTTPELSNIALSSTHTHFERREHTFELHSPSKADPFAMNADRMDGSWHNDLSGGDIALVDVQSRLYD